MRWRPEPHDLLRALALPLVLAVAAWAYLPSLHGPFLFDDIPNLQALARIDDAFGKEFWMYAATGIAGPTGRPLALFSFALQHDSWPSDSASFRSVNLAIHLLTAALIAWLALLIARRAWAGDERRATTTAVLCAALWVLHPLQVSTVVYVVQRMTELAALFSVAGLLAYAHGRERVAREPERLAGYLWAAGGIGLGGLLATLSKETGVLVPLFALVLEHTVYASDPVPARWRWARHALLHAPLVAFVALVAARFDQLILAKYAIRDYSLLERVLSQPRALLEYLGLIVLPSPARLTLFNDDFLPSRGLLDPPTTLLALLAILALLAAGIALRRRQPLLSLAILWFLAGHALESTILPLELYFEHRNYLPLFGPALAAAYGAQRLLEVLRTLLARTLVPLLLVVLLAAFALMARVEARLWGDPLVLATVWADENPDSLRAQSYRAGMLRQIGRHDEAAAEYARLAVRFPLDAMPYTEWVEIACLSDSVALPDEVAVLARLRTTRFSYSPMGSIDGILQEFERDGDCGRATGGYVGRMIEALLDNPALQPERSLLLVLRGRLQVVRGEFDAALASYAACLALKPRLDVAVQRIRIAARLERWDDARRFVEEARAVARRTPLQALAAGPVLDQWQMAIERRMPQPATG